MKVHQDRAYFLHSRPFRENSLIAQLLTESHGLVNFLISGIKPKQKTGASKGALLQPCHTLCIDYQLKDNLSKLTHLERIDFHPPLGYENFMLYQYTHEILLYLLPNQLPLPTVFQAYETCLRLFRQEQPNCALRHIEIALIEHFCGFPYLQYALDMPNIAIIAEQNYFYVADQGLYQNKPNQYATQFTGDQILAFNHFLNKQLTKSKTTDEILAKGAQAVSTFFITQLLNGKPLKTRNIYRDLQHFK